MKDSNENHIFINEKLNQALKKMTQRLHDLELKYEGVSGISIKSTESSSKSNEVVNDAAPSQKEKNQKQEVVQVIQ